MIQESVQLSLRLAKRILRAVHEEFVEHFLDNSRHIPRIRRIIEAVRDHLGDEDGVVEEELRDYAFQLYRDRWISLAEQDDEEVDVAQEEREAERVFFSIYNQADAAGEEEHNQ